MDWIVRHTLSSSLGSNAVASGRFISALSPSFGVEECRGGEVGPEATGVRWGKALAVSNDVGDSLGIGTAFRNPDSMWDCQGGKRCMSQKGRGL
jgi:hypothetical protein